MSENAAEGAKPDTVAPGTEYVVEAGMLYEITDNNGVALSIKGVESPWVMEFLKAYDAWQSIGRTLGPSHEQTMVSRVAVDEKWDEMPLRLVQDMPSYRAGGIVVPGGS